MSAPEEDIEESRLSSSEENDPKTTSRYQEGGGPKVEVLSRKRGENEMVSAVDDDDDSEIKFKAREECSPAPLSDLHRLLVNDKHISPNKERSSQTEKSNRLYSDKISPKKHRRTSVIAKLIDNEESDTEEEREAEKQQITSNKNPLQEDERNAVETRISVVAKKVLESPKQSKKRVSFAPDVEVMEARQEGPAERPPAPSLPDKAAGDPRHGQLEIVWAKIGGHPWWPGIVCNDPDLQIFTRTKRRGNKLVWEMNVCFFGENTRAWVDEKNLRSFDGLEEFENFKSEALKNVSSKTKQKLMKALNPTNAIREKWTASVKGGEKVSSLAAELRMEEIMNLNKQMSASTSCNNKKRRLSVDLAPAHTEDEAEAPAKRLKLDVEEDGGEARRGGGATRRQQDIKLKQEEREKKEKDKGPGWYYELVPVKKPSVEPEVVHKLGHFTGGRCCLQCEEAGGLVLKCRGCSGHFHPQCQQGVTNTQSETFRCDQCQAGLQQCFLCLGRCGAMEEETLRRCSVSGCGKSYHVACLTRYTIWPQTKITNDTLYCPAHTCHTCASDDPKDPVMKYSGKLMHCTKCPTTYHSGDHCVAAGTIQITKTDIICPKHFSPAKSKKGAANSHVNTNWCFICSTGGSLLCCEKCPASFHEDCLGLTEPLGDKYYCEHCQSGRLPLYDDIVWAKWGAWRWWPALVLHPTNVPDNIEKVKHQDGEFPVKFLGSGDYNWINHGRTFFYEDGDSEKNPNLSSTKSMDATFRRGLAEAEELFKATQEARMTRERQNCMSRAGSKTKGGNKPQYVKIKNNKPYGNCPTYSVDPEECQACDCDKGKDRENPCSDESNCMNRMLMFECHPNVCPVKDSCRNMRFLKREYPPLECFRTLEGRGWGLRSSHPIKKGQFVIEYVGELITMEEYRKRMAVDQLAGQENYYYLTIDSNRMIDAGPKGNLARFMNHSCDPNCITQKWTVNGDTRVGLFAIKDVPPGSELTFNYQFETVGDDKKKCMCGAANCSGLIGEKPQNKEKDEKKVYKMLIKKKKKKKKSSKGPRLLSVPSSHRVSTLPVPALVKAKQEKVCEEYCFRCGEAGSLLPCDSKRCPKVYHLLCVAREEWPATGPWLCPWHVCFKCSKRADLWCRHCPTSVCAEHSGNISVHPVLGSVCDQHEEADLQFLVNFVQQQGLHINLPCPSPSQEQLKVWRTAREVPPPPPGLEPSFNTHRHAKMEPGQRASLSDVTNIDITEKFSSTHRKSDKLLERLEQVVDCENNEKVRARQSLCGGWRCQTCQAKLSKPAAVFSHCSSAHPDIPCTELTVRHLATNKILPLNSIFRFVVQCDSSGCNNFAGANTNIEEAIEAVRKHWVRNHLSYTVQEKDFCYTDISVQNEIKNVKSSLFGDGNSPVLRISVPIFNPSSGNISFSKKGYEGPYHCLRQGCGFVLDEFGLGTQKKLVNHWSTDHGDIRSMLYFDQHSNSAINVKIILNNVGYCSHPGCDAVLFSSRKGDFSSNINHHWKKAHPAEDPDNLVNIISTAPDFELTEDEALSLVMKLPIVAGNSLQMSEYEENSIVGSINEDEVEIDEEVLGESESEDVEFAGPYKCTGCDYQVKFNVTSNRLALDHWIRIHDPKPQSLQFIDIPTGRVLTVGHFFKTIGRCLAENCGHIIGNNGRDAALFKRIRKHWTEHHTELAATPDKDKVEVVDVGEAWVGIAPRRVNNLKHVVLAEPNKVPAGQRRLKCSHCERMLDVSPGSFQSTIQHWLKHSLHPVTLKLVTKDGLELSIKELYKWVLRCGAPTCSYLAVSNVSEKDAEGKVREHWARSHNISCPAKIEEVRHLGYQCCLCEEVVRDRDNFWPHLRHNHLDHEVVDITSLHLTNLETGVKVSLSTQEVEEGAMVTTQTQEPEEEVSVFQCPAMMKGGRQCPDLAMDIDTLRVHWSTQHSSNVAEFKPEELSITNVIHIQCPVPGCHFKHLSTNAVRNHWETDHRDHPDKFRVIQHIINKDLLEETTGRKRRRSSGDSNSSPTTAAKKKNVDCSNI